MRLFPALNARLQPFLDLIFPPRCVHCGQLGAWLCETCLQEAQPVGKDICVLCGNPLTSRGVCHRCRQTPPEPLRGIRGVYFYNGPIAQGIRSLKYHGVRALAPILADGLIAYIQAQPLHIDFLAPVPLHAEKQAARGFNQSELLAQAVARALNIPLRTDLVQRIRPTAPQARLDRSQRLQNVSGAFAALPGVHLQHQPTLLLIDDVATTGATLRACAQALKQAGAGDVWALTVARAALPVHRDGPDAPPSAADAFLLWHSAHHAIAPDPPPSTI